MTKSEAFRKLVGSVDTPNMAKMRLEVKNFESLNFEEKQTSGYGEGVFVISVKMAHPRFGEVFLTLPQCAEDGSEGKVSLTPLFGEFGFINSSYSF